MKIGVKVEEFALVVASSCYNGTGEVIEVTWHDLKTAEIGTAWSADYTQCGRDMSCNSAKVVYKDDKGAAVLMTRYGSTDDPNPEGWEDDPVLTWFEFK